MKFNASVLFVWYQFILAMPSAVLGNSPTETPRSSITRSLKRQLPTGAFDPSQIPSQCDGSCSTILSTIQTCTQLTCLCTNSVAASIASCVDCLVAVGGEQGTGQNIINQYQDACQTSDMSVTSIIVSSVAPSSSPFPSASAGSQNATLTSSIVSSSPGTVSPASTSSQHASSGIRLGIFEQSSFVLFVISLLQLALFAAF